MLNLDFSDNLLISAMTAIDRAALAPFVQRIALSKRQQLVAPGVPIEYCYFLESGIASVVSEFKDAAASEIGICGRDGVTGIAVLLGSDRTPHETFIQVSGASALQVKAGDLIELTEQRPTIRHLLLKYVQTFITQIACSAHSNAYHRLEARLASWLLMCHDRAGNDQINITHEYMSMMIGAQRTGVTMALHTLEGQNIIRSIRAKVIILDRKKLEKAAGDSYGLPEAEYLRLIGVMANGNVVGLSA